MGVLRRGLFEWLGVFKGFELFEGSFKKNFKGVFERVGGCLMEVRKIFKKFQKSNVFNGALNGVSRGF